MKKLIYHTPKNFSALEADFEYFLDQAIAEVEITELTPEKRRLRKLRTQDNDLAFAKEYFPGIFDLPFNDVHKHIASLKSGFHLISGFRYSGKTAFTLVAKIIKPLAVGVKGIIDISLRTQQASEDRTLSLFRLISRNRKLMYDYEIDIQREKIGSYMINGTQLIATSVNEGLRNYVDDNFKRFKIAVADDTYNRVTVASQRDNEKVEDFVESELRGQIEPDGLCLFLGNSITEECPMMRLREKGYSHFSLPALAENGDSTWPAFRTTEQWQEFFKTIPFEVREGDYMDKPAVKGEVIDADWLYPVNLNLIKILVAISAVDPARGQSGAACDMAMTTGGLTDKQKVVILDMYVRKASYLEFFDYVNEIRNRPWPWKALLFENDFAQWGFAAPYYRDWLAAPNKPIPIELYTAKSLATKEHAADKESRCLTVVHPLQTGMMGYNEEIKNHPAFKELIRQMTGFGKSGVKLDALDSLAAMYLNIFRYVHLEKGGFRSLKKRTWEKTERWFRRR